ncbi:hypothetical protein AAV99_00715 [Aurantiacibacter marinus]|uniref:Uncharacterized protein n=2 Tax=Aurantiacibacter marinus TaxID=874156 RepID=A0A0H0XSW3_9SPHN|nr:hypothetical protein AAV99_00715 [Aurantiacibacter marinus]
MSAAVTPAAPAEQVYVALGGTRAERFQRLQIGGFGILAMILLIGLADIVITRAQETEANSVPEAAPTVAASETSAPSDPLADAGVVPDVPATPTPAAADPSANKTGDVPPPSSVPNAPLQ